MRHPICVILLSAVALAHTVTLHWIESQPQGLTYNVWRSNTQGTGYVQINPAPVNAFTYSDHNVWNGSTYYYVVTWWNGTINSAYSNEVAVSCYCHRKNLFWKVCSCWVSEPGVLGGPEVH